MRLPVISGVLSLILLIKASQGFAFEIESETYFPASLGTEELRIISTTDTELFSPLIEAFQRQQPGISVTYVTASSTDVIEAIQEGSVFDVAISSAMDLQTKLANDGYVRPYSSAQTRSLPPWATWRDQVFSFTREPAAIVISPAAFAGLEIPRTRQDLITLLRDNADRFNGRIGTYDIRSSGLGYLFATQDSRNSETFWRLSEVMGSLETRLYCCSSEMITDVSSGKIAIAYNVLGSYAQARQNAGDSIQVIIPEDYVNVMLRTAVIPATAQEPELAGAFVDFLIAESWNAEAADRSPFLQIETMGVPDTAALRPIPLGPGLLVFLDRLKRKSFLREWEDAVTR